MHLLLLLLLLTLLRPLALNPQPHTCSPCWCCSLRLCCGRVGCCLPQWQATNVWQGSCCLLLLCRACCSVLLQQPLGSCHAAAMHNSIKGASTTCCSAYCCSF